MPIAKKLNPGDKATSRYSYSPAYTPMYVAFRYVAWDAGGGPINPATGNPYGEIVSGPLSKVVKILHKNVPFIVDAAASATYGAPCAYINGMHVPTVLHCMIETHLPSG